MDKMKKLHQGNNEFPYGNLESSVLQACFQASKFEADKSELDRRRRIAGMQFPVSSVKKSWKPKTFVYCQKQYDFVSLHLFQVLYL